MRLWVADVEKGLMLLDEGGWRAVGPPCRALCRVKGGMCWAGDREGGLADAQGRAQLRFSVPPGVCAMEAAGNTLYLLSSDADSLTALDAATGQIRCCAPAGAYPRALAASPDGKTLAAAGGAAGEVMVFDRSLQRLAVFRVPGVAVGVCFAPKGLTALCAVGEGEVSALMLRISPSGVTKEAYACSQTPCCLCRTGDGCAVGCCGKVCFLSALGRVIRSFPCPCPYRMRMLEGAALIADPWQGRVLLSDGACLYRGGSPEDALLVSRS